jgi:hypothetical protein
MRSTFIRNWDIYYDLIKVKEEYTTGLRKCAYIALYKGVGIATKRIVSHNVKIWAVLRRKRIQRKTFFCYQRPNPKKNMVCAGVDYNFTLFFCLLQQIYNGQPYARVDFIPRQGLWI